ncbi:Crp/Fnr family transcriptional regulator [Falsiroseomonas sp.]|uniref:Crp/Fnr family transcriptional regulator n=1 Tax=Falsiroseomonas sp. TaxID=2870721 RepID=UPI0035695013
MSGALQAPADPQQRVEALRRQPLLAGLPEPALCRVAEQARWRALAPGELVVDTGDASAEVYFVTAGAVRVVLRSAGGQELILNDLGAGALFGELAAIDGISRSASVTALSRAQLCSVRGPVFLDLVLHNPTAGLHLLRLLAARVRAKDQLRLEAAAFSARQRIVAELLRLSAARPGGEARISPPPPQHELAARLSLRRETVSREVAKLAREGLLTVQRGALVLHRPEALRAELEQATRGGA